MDIVEFAETVLEIKLLESQKKLLREFQKMPKDAVLVRTRNGWTWLTTNPEFITKFQQKPLSPDEIDICPKCRESGHWKKGENYDSTII